METKKPQNPAFLVGALMLSAIEIMSDDELKEESRGRSQERAQGYGPRPRRPVAMPCDPNMVNPCALERNREILSRPRSAIRLREWK